MGLGFLITGRIAPFWEVRVSTARQLSDIPNRRTGRLSVGNGLTYNASRAKINVASIGNVESIEYSVRLLETNSTDTARACAGTMAPDLGPPRLFFVDTPSAVALISLRITLEVDDAGASPYA